MFKNILPSALVVFYYLILVFILKDQIYIFSAFMVSGFIFSRYLFSVKQVVYSFSILFLVFFLSLFDKTTKINISIIYLIFIPITFLLGFYLKKRNVILKILYVAVIILISKFGFNNLWAITKNFNAREVLFLKNEIVLNDSEGKMIKLGTESDKIVVLDFWTSSCGVCFEGFDEYEKIYNKYKYNSRIDLYVVNIPYKDENIKQLDGLLKDYNFPKLYSKDQQLMKFLNFNSVPHLIILKGNQIVFNGSLILDKNIFFYNLDNELERLL